METRVRAAHAGKIMPMKIVRFYGYLFFAGNNATSSSRQRVRVRERAG